MSCSRSCSTVRSRRSAGNFTVDDVVNGICEKMIRRHPRIFGGEIPEVEDEKDLWEAIKKQEREMKKKARKALTKCGSCACPGKTCVREGKNAEKHGKIGQNSLTKNAETYINVRVQCKGPSGRLCPRVLK